jgi:hypothetical protein
MRIRRLPSPFTNKMNLIFLDERSLAPLVLDSDSASEDSVEHRWHSSQKRSLNKQVPRRQDFPHAWAMGSTGSDSQFNRKKKQKKLQKRRWCDVPAVPRANPKSESHERTKERLCSRDHPAYRSEKGKSGWTNQERPRVFGGRMQATPRSMCGYISFFYRKYKHLCVHRCLCLYK